MDQTLETTSKPKHWFTLALTIDREIEDCISSILWDNGTLGIVTANETATTLTLLSYFDRNPDISFWQQTFTEVLSQIGYPTTAINNLTVAEVPDEDWLKKWKEGYQPFTVGERFLVTPSWAREEPKDAHRVVIEIDPGMAFGTGTHETTRLCLEAIERYWQGGRLLDVGTGTGILTIGAAKLSPQNYFAACDNDPEAIIVAKENLAINHVEDLIDIAVASAKDYATGDFNLIVANLTADVIIPMVGDLEKCLAPDGKVILSGILDIQQDQVCQTLTDNGWQILEINRDGEWISIIAHH